MGSCPSEFRLYGIFGFPLGHTLSPAIQEAAFRDTGIKAFYLPLEVRPAQFHRLIRKRKDLVLDGFNITVPYKEAALRGLDGVSPEARAIGAVNTAVRRGNRWFGFNTDWIGFSISLERDERYRIRGKRVWVLGAGGSARAVIYALAKRRAQKIVIANRTLSRAGKMARQYRVLFPKVQFETVRLSKALLKGKDARFTDIDLVVNATSVGLKGDDEPLLDPKSFPRRTLFFDLIYRPAETKFIKRARLSGHRTMNGLGMLIHQGAEAFRIWTGKKAPVPVMRNAIK